MDKAEFIRLVLVASGQKFEDNTIPDEEWLARRAGYYGKTNLDGLRIDEVVQLSEDLKIKMVDWYLEEDEAKKAEAQQKLKDELFPKFLGFFESLLNQNGGNGFFVGNSVTLADFVVYDIVETVLDMNPEAIATFPSVKKLRNNVEAVPAIKTYLASRQKTDI
nr:hypothetical protein BaRGS_029384 [Batillaria attramentaria]